MSKFERRQCEVEGCDRPRKGTNRVCSYHIGVHDPVPDHYVAAERSCIRCGDSFASAWSGERICASERGHGYAAGRIAAFADGRCEVDMDSGSRLSIPWWELVDARVPPQERVKALLLIALICEAPYEAVR